MNILLVSATEKEIAPLVAQLSFVKDTNLRLRNCSYKNHSIDLLVTGVGMIATAYHLTKALPEKRYDLSINLGIAGSFDKKIQLGSVVNVTRDRFSEIGAEDGNDLLSPARIGLMDENEFPFTKGELINSSAIKNTVVDTLLKAKGITVNTIHGNETSINKMRSMFSPETESMEGAAFLYVCLLEKTPCLQIRAISNFIKRDREKWDVPLAIKNLNQTATELLNHF